MAYTTWGDNYDPTEVDQGGLPKPGKCQLLVTSAEEHEDTEKPTVSVKNQIIAHEDPTQVGKISYNTLNLTGKASKRALLFALATGLVNKDDLAQFKASGGGGGNIDYTQAYGSVYFATLVASEYNGKPKCRVEWDMKALDDPEAKDYPASNQFPYRGPKETVAVPGVIPQDKTLPSLPAGSDIPW